MARDEEKAMSMMNKYLKQREQVEKGTWDNDERRPFIASECNNLKDAEKWRRHVIKEVSGKISEIQNAGLGEHRIRDLNDEINKLLKVKWYWEEQIIKLGGPDYHTAQKTVDASGHEIPGHTGYKYFGAAKDLPGVRELFDRVEAPEQPRKTRKMLFSQIQPDYYGWRDEEDGMLLVAEIAAEEQMQKILKEEWAKKPRSSKKAPTPLAEQNPTQEKLDETYATFVNVPTPDDIQDMILAKKKQMLMNKYVSSSEQSKQGDASDLATK